MRKRLKRWGALALALLMAGMLCACAQGSGEERAAEVKRVVVEATCETEGYVEHWYEDGYVCRDSFTPKTQHDYLEYTLGAEHNLTRYICRHCGREKVLYEEVEVNTDVVVDPTRERPSFVGLDVMVCAMILERTPDEAILAIRRAEQKGAYGFMVYVSCLEPQYRTLQSLQRIMHCTQKPVLAIAYSVNTFFPQNLSFDEMASLLTLSVEAGAAAVDLQGYMWDTDTLGGLRANRAYWTEQGYDMSFVSASPAEVSGDPLAIQKQAEFTKSIHEMGGEVLLSVHASAQMSAEQIVAMAKYLDKIDVDIIKMVVGGSSNETVIEHLKACNTLSQAGTLSAKFSVHGQSTLSRLMCPMFGSYIAFCVDEYTEAQTNIQIDLETMLAIMNSPEMKAVLR